MSVGGDEVRKRGYFQLYIAHEAVADLVVNYLAAFDMNVVPVPVQVEGNDDGLLRLPNDEDEDVCHIVQPKVRPT